MRHRGRPGLVTCALSVLLTLVVPAPARPQGEASPRPGWLPPLTQWADDMTTAQRAAAMIVLREIERLVLQIPELASPDGFEIEPAFAGGYRLLGPDDAPMPNSLLRYNYGLKFYAPTKAIAGEGAICVSVVVNDNPPPEAHRSAGGLRIWEEGERGTPVPHATLVLGDLGNVPGQGGSVGAIFVSAGELPWRQVTREELVATLLEEVEPNVEEARQALEKTPYQEWMEGAAERRRTREEVLREAALSQTPAEVEAMRQALEASEHEVTEQLRAGEAEMRGLIGEARSGLGGLGDSLRATLERMSPEERSLPAFVTSSNVLRDAPRAMGYAFTPDTLPPARRLLTPNWAFWRPRRSPVEVRSVGVSIATGFTCGRPTARHALFETYRKIDWAAIERLLDHPRDELHPGA